MAYVSFRLPIKSGQADRQGCSLILGSLHQESIYLTIIVDGIFFFDQADVASDHMSDESAREEVGGGGGVSDAQVVL